jgi:hypothetical protein
MPFVISMSHIFRRRLLRPRDHITQQKAQLIRAWSSGKMLGLSPGMVWKNCLGDGPSATNHTVAEGGWVNPGRSEQGEQMLQ